MRTDKLLTLGACLWLAVSPAFASDYRGQVNFNGLPVPGVTVTATQGDKKLSTITDPMGSYDFPDLADGVWTVQLEMLTFSTITQEVTVAPGAQPAQWELKLLPLGEIKAEVAPPAPAAPAAPAKPVSAKPQSGRPGAAPTNTQTAYQRANLNASANAPAQAAAPPQSDTPTEPNIADVSERAADGFLINGTANNGASSPFALNAAFGNNRRGPRSLYNGNLGLVLDNSALDARTFSFTGQDTVRPAYTHVQGNFNFAGPLQIPHVLRNGPNFFIAYQWVRNRNVTTTPGLVPTEDERNGILPGLTIPANQISPQAAALLRYYPLPNFTGSSVFNYQIPVIGGTHQDNAQARLNKTLGRTNQLSGAFGFQSTRGDNPNLLGFLDTNRSLGLNFAVNWRHNFTPRFFTNLGFQYSRQSARLVPFFQNRENVSGLAGITGNNQEPVNWGPPGLNFLNGISGLSDAAPSFTRNQTAALSDDTLWNHGRHNITFGADYRKQQFNLFSQQDPRGSFTFTGAVTGNALGDFLLGIPDTSAIAFGNADKYFRASSYDAYFSDDWRMSPSFTLNAGVRWEYWSPITELYGRLVNLDVAPGFTAVTPVVANAPVGPLTGLTYPDSLLQPDKHAFQPRVAFSWRPIAASSLVVRGGYGVYYNTSVYQSIASQMAQQSPLSKSLSVQNTAANPLTLANGFNASPNITTNTFAVDPNLRVGYSQNWQLSVQRDLPAALQLTATYLGIKGTRGIQEFLPNTYPAGAVSPCLSCPSGFVYMTSNGNSTREAGQLQLRRRLHNGFTATLNYTYAKAIDDAALGGRGQGAGVIAQNWLDLSAERGLSSFDQRHLLSVQAQYTTGMGLGGGTLVNGWKGALFKEWTVQTQINAGTGLPLTPLFPSAVRGTGVTGPVRPDYTGAPVYAAPAGLFLNPAAYTTPAPGQWGNAGRNSITGPSQFSLNASLGRTFRMSDRLSLDLRVDASNALNHVTFPSWNTIVGNAQFGLPTVANAMRTVQTTMRLRF